MTDERFVLELMPYIITMLSIVMVFFYLIARMMFAPRKKKQLDKNLKQEPDGRIETVIHRAIDLDQRVRNIEEIIKEDRR